MESPNPIPLRALPQRTNREQVVYYDNNRNWDRCAGSCARLLVSFVIFIVCVALISPYSRSSKSSRSHYSKPTTYTKNRYSPSSSSTRENYWTPFLTQETYQRNIISPMKESCDREICKQIVDYTISSMNKSVDPCENFYDYACQGWEEKNPRPGYAPEWSVFHMLQAQNTKRVISILEEPSGNSNPNPLNTAKQFYKKCVEIGNEKDESEDKAAVQLMRNAMEKYGGWPILYENGTWNKSRFDWTSSMIGLKRQFQSFALLDVFSFQYPAWLGEQRNSIFIKPVSSSSSSSLERIETFLEGSKSLETLTNLIVNISKVFLEFQGKSNVHETYLEEKALETVLLIVFCQVQANPLTN